MADIQPVMDVGMGNSYGTGWGGALVGGIVGFLAGAATGGGGFFGGRNGANANTVIGLTNEGLALKTQSDITAMSNRISDNLCSGFAGVNNGICGIQQTLLTGFGNITHQNDMNTCDIKTAIGASTQTILNQINANTMQDLRDRNVELASALNNSAQSATIISALSPKCPVPSYVVPNPNVATFAAPYPYAPYPYPAPFFDGCRDGFRDGCRDGRRFDGCGGCC